MTGDDLLDRLLALPPISRAYLSPDGRQVAFTWRRGSPAQNVFAVPADGSQPPTALTGAPQVVHLVSWAPDSRSVVVAQDQDGDERFQLFRVDLAQPGKLQPLTEPHPPYFIRGGSLSPDGRYLYYSANFDAASGKVLEAAWIYRHDLRTGERLPLARPAQPAWTEPALNLRGSHLVYGRKDRSPAGRQFHLVALSGQPEDREILNTGDDLKVFARWFPDGDHLAVLAETGDNPTNRYNRLGVYSIQDGALRWLLDDPRRDLQSVWVGRDGRVIVNEVHQAARCPTLLDPHSGVELPFPQTGGNLLPLGPSAFGEWVGVYYAADSPEEIVRFRFEPGKPAAMLPLASVWEAAGLTPPALVKAEDFRWRAPDGLEVQGWLYRAAPNRRRAILYIHGGPSSHAENRLSPQIQYFAARGFNVLAVNYRGSTGFGLAYREKIKEDGWGGREQEDIASGAAALIRAGLAEAGRIGVTGTSYGGYSAWCQVTRYPPELIAAAAPICGMTDLAIDYETTRPDLRPYLVEMMGGAPSELPEKYRQRSPLHFVQNIRARLLIVQGANDPNVTPENVRQVQSRLEARHIPYDLLVFEDEGHGIHKRQNQAALIRRLADFFDSALR
ncbi:MAG: S9 family peptidase [Anaerolineae bacterium]|nr:S9 family peptidase [Anaerolineae bacterium]